MAKNWMFVTAELLNFALSASDELFWPPSWSEEASIGPLLASQTRWQVHSIENQLVSNLNPGDWSITCFKSGKSVKISLILVKRAGL